MKKHLFIAFALVASVAAITSCSSKNDPDEPKSVTLKDIVGTKWRVDSAYVDEDHSVLSGMYQAFQIKSETTFKYLEYDELYTFSVKDHQVTAEEFGSEPFTIIEATDQYIHLEGTTDKYDEQGEIVGKTKLRLSLGRIPDSNGEKEALTKDNVVGVWKADFYVESGVYSGSDETWSRFLISVNYHGLDIYTLKEDGTLVFENLMEKWLMGSQYQAETGFWRIEDGRLVMAIRYDGDTSTEPMSNEINDVVELTGNVMYLRSYWQSTTTDKFFHKMK